MISLWRDVNKKQYNTIMSYESVLSENDHSLQQSKSENIKVFLKKIVAEYLKSQNIEVGGNLEQMLILLEYN